MSIIRSQFEKRFAPYQDRLNGYAVAMTRDRDAASDLLHDSVARAIASRNRPADESAFRAWLFTIMRNLWIDKVRADRRWAKAAEAITDSISSSPVSLESVVVNAFAVRQAFELLSDDHREVLALVDISGFSYDEAATMLVVPRGTVMSRVSRARHALAELLADDRVNVIAFPTASKKP